MTTEQLSQLLFKKSYPYTQRFGQNPQMYKKFGLKGHNGIDYGVPMKTPVYAVANGYVLWAKKNGAYGNEVRLTHSGGGQTNYGHLKNFKVKNGQKVIKSQLLGYSNNTGNSTGPHLHFGYRKHGWNENNGYGGWVDPLKTLRV